MPAVPTPAGSAPRATDWMRLASPDAAGVPALGIAAPEPSNEGMDRKPGTTPAGRATGPAGAAFATEGWGPPPTWGADAGEACATPDDGAAATPPNPLRTDPSTESRDWKSGAAPEWPLDVPAAARSAFDADASPGPAAKDSGGVWAMIGNETGMACLQFERRSQISGRLGGLLLLDEAEPVGKVRRAAGVVGARIGTGHVLEDGADDIGLHQ